MRAQITTLLLLAASGFFQAAFALPVRHFRAWRWEQMWVAQSVAANVLFPVGWAMAVPAAFWSQAARLPWFHWLGCYGWGLLWGLGGVAWSLTLTGLGIAFANSFVMGVSILTGALFPLLLNAVEPPSRPWHFTVSLGLCLLGTVLVGVFRRHGKHQPFLPMPTAFRTYPRLLALAVFAGFSTAGYGLAFTFAFSSIRTLVVNGISPLSASLVVVLPVYLGAASVAIPLGLAVAARAGGLPLFGRFAGRNCSLALSMGLCAMATAVLYGVAGSRSGHPAPNVCFGLFVNCLVLGGVGLGFATGEMRGLTAGARTGLVLSACGLAAGAWLLNAR